MTMGETFNVYCDESCHLEHDRQAAMVLGALWCPRDSVRETAVRMRAIKKRHGLSSDFEAKWTKVSPGQGQFYFDLVDYFFDSEDLHFRALIVPDKSVLDHDLFGQDHDTWYYKMYFDMLKAILDPDSRYRIWLDIKDTRSVAKVRKLHDVLCSNIYDFDHRVIDSVDQARSHEVEQLQLADLLIGAVSYANRGLSGSETKTRLVRQVRARSRYALTKTTLLRERKFNLLVWSGRGD
jgi:hypothetical protein